jgi:hypothetical protein
MKVLMSVAATLAVAIGFGVISADKADAGCGIGWRCNAAVLVPAPNPIPIRRVRPRVVAPAPCVAPCGLPPGPTAYRYQAPAYYAYYKQPAYWGECGLSTCNTYWRRNCWYDSFGRRFCN